MPQFLAYDGNLGRVDKEEKGRNYCLDQEKTITRDGIYLIMGAALGLVIGAVVQKTIIGLMVGAVAGVLIDEFLYHRRLRRIDR